MISCYLTVGCSAVVIELEHSAEIPAYGLDITSLHVHPQHGDRLIVTTAEGVYRLTESECTVSFIHTYYMDFSVHHFVKKTYVYIGMRVSSLRML